MVSTKINTIRQNWGLSKNESSTTGLYALTIVDTSPFGFTASTTLPGQILEFAFNMNPKQMSMEEPNSVVITPTQNGQFVENQGQIFKNISISGTTGLRPNATAPGGIIPIFGVLNPFVDSNIDPETGLPRGEVTGFEILINLKNLFREYSDRKRDIAVAHRTIMIWQNGKEGEFYIVEPISFRTSRESNSPLTTSYDIQLRTISKWEVADLHRGTDSVDTKGFFGTIQDLNKRLSLAFGLMSSLVDRTASLGQSILTTILSPINTIITGMTNIIVSSQRFLAIPRYSITTLMNNLTGLIESVDGYRDEVNAYKQKGGISVPAVFTNAAKIALWALGGVYNQDKLFSATISSILTNKLKSFINPLTGNIDISSSTGINNIFQGNSIAQAVVGGSDDIRTLALRLMGDANQWKVLVILNKLKAPYISISGDGISVLRPLDSIIYPITSSSPSTGISSSTNEDGLGRDLKIDFSTSELGTNLGDFLQDSSGDLMTIEGPENMDQAVNARCSTEQGQLPLHPEYGILFPIGEKAKIRTLLAFHINARASLLADPRIEDITSLKAFIKSSSLTIQASLRIKNSNTVFPFNIDIIR